MFLRGALPDCGGSTAMQVQGAAVQGAPQPVAALDAVEDRVVHVQLRVVIARVVLKEARDHQVVRVDEPARGAAVVAHSGVAGVLGQVIQHRPVPGPGRVLIGALSIIENDLPAALPWSHNY
nr:hypothetical protein [Amycolatopsis pithecellobii]